MKTKKGFTLIELIVVIAVLGILILLAAPRFLGHTAEAKLAQIKADIKTYETVYAAEITEDDELTKDWEIIEKAEMEEYRDSDSLISKNGKVNYTYEFNLEYIEVPKNLGNVKSSLKGEFILETGGNIYYYEKGLKIAEDENSEEEINSGGSNSGDSNISQTPNLDPLADNDGDGVNNRDEIALGTDPNNKDSVIFATPASDFKFKQASGGLYIDGYSGTSNKLVIPPYIDGQPVIGIEAGGLSKFTPGSGNIGPNLVDIVIPNTVEEIRDSALRNNSLIEVVIPGSVKTIGVAAFSGNSITKVELNEGTEIIEEWAFRYNNIINIVIPDSVETVGVHAFRNNEIESVKFGSGTQIAKVGIYAFAKTNTPNGTITAPAEKKSIIFDSKNQKNLDWVNLVESSSPELSLDPTPNLDPLADNDGDGVINRDEIALGTDPNDKNSVIVSTPAENFAFKDVAGSAGLTIVGYSGTDSNIVIPPYVNGKPVTAIAEASLAKGLSSSGNKGAELTEITIPNTVEVIETNAVRGNKILQVTIPSSVETIGDFSFYGNQITKVNLNEGLKHIGHSSFRYNTITNIVIPDSVEYIGSSAFRNNILETVEFTHNTQIKSTGTYFFAGASFTPGTITGPAEKKSVIFTNKSQSFKTWIDLP